MKIVHLKRFVKVQAKSYKGLPSRGFLLYDQNRKTHSAIAQEKHFLKENTSLTCGLFQIQMDPKHKHEYASNGDIIFLSEFKKFYFFKIERVNYFDPLGPAARIRIEIRFGKYHILKFITFNLLFNLQMLALNLNSIVLVSQFILKKVFFLTP